MKSMNRIALIMFFLLGSVLPGWAIEFTGTGMTGTVTYTEPTENADGSPLIDLDRTEYRTGNDVDGMGDWVSVVATSPNGGGLITLPGVTIPLPAGPTETTGRIHVRACDDAGQREASTTDNCGEIAETTREIDTLPPAVAQ